MSQNAGESGGSRGSTGTTRRTFLAAGSVVALAGMAGCLDRIAGAMTDTSSSPAAAMTGAVASGGAARLADLGDTDGRMLDVGDWHVEPVEATVSAGLSTSVDLESWATTAQAKAQDYNSVRSNKRRSEIALEEPDEGDTDDEEYDRLVRRLYDYLGDSCVVGESFTVTLPDASLPGGSSVAAEITPERILEFLTGQQVCIREEGEVYCWGRNERASDDEGALEWAWDGTPAQLAPGGERSFVITGSGGSVCVSVVNDPPTATDRSAGKGGGAGKVNIQDLRINKNLGSWGEETERDGVTVSEAVVAPVVALPEGAPMVMPALVYFRRCKHEDEYIYTGGWVVDDSALYDDSCTILSLEGPNDVVSFTGRDVADDRASAALVDRMRRERRPRGAALYDGTVDVALLGSLPAAFGSDEGRRAVVSHCGQVLEANGTGRNPQTGKEIKIPLASDAGDGDPLRCGSVALDCPLVHHAGGGSTPEKRAAIDAFLTIDGVEGESRR